MSLWVVFTLGVLLGLAVGAALLFWWSFRGMF